MKQLFWSLFITLNLIMGTLYTWGADHNRYICACLWAIVPTVNLIIYCIFEKQITGENYEINR